MDSSKLRVEFQQQISDADTKIDAAQKTLNSLKEYKFKLQGGLETLDLLDGTKEEEEPPTDK
tara:strand:- start:307 stop:492 length:186 start_codon:yes stop_codon:yes gene_type:complete